MNDIGERIGKLSESMGDDITEVTLRGMEKSQQLKEHIDDKKQELSERSAAVKSGFDEKSEEFKKQIAEKNERLSEMSSELKEHLEIKRIESAAERAERKAQIEAEIAALRERSEKLRSVRRSGQRRLLRAFPGMKNARFQAEIEQLKKAAAEGRKWKNK